MGKYIIHNGTFASASSSVISHTDRSFRFGDGIFETILVANGKMYDFISHLERLKNGLAYFSIELNFGNIEKYCQQLIEKNSLDEGYVRVVISRGNIPENSVGYSPDGAKPYFVIETSEKKLPEFKTISLAISSWRLFYKFPCKTNNSLPYCMALLEASQKGFANALMLDNNDNVCEAATGNVFWVKKGVLHTPHTSLPFIPGTISKKITDLYQGEIQHCICRFNELETADEVFISNVGGIITSVSSIEGVDRRFEDRKVATHLRQVLIDEILKETVS
ncbi:MAG TPA: hypothetical protein DIV86_07250 [Alphaproteobacteria bacterium]|nr:hypothetical protein [Alphaproteobacteria bacterium]